MKTTILPLLFASALPAADPLIGVWKLDRSLTKTEPPVTFVLARDGEFYKISTATSPFKMDLRDYPAASGETMDWRRSGPLYVSTFKKDGRVLRTYHNHVAPGGERARVIQRVYSVNGRVTESERLYERTGGTVDPADPLVGEWRVGPITRSTASGILRFESHGDGHRYISQTDPGYSAAYDGKDYPNESGGQSDAVSLRRVDASTVETTFKQGGKARSVTALTVSEHGQTMVMRSKTANSNAVTTQTYRRYTLNQRAGIWKLNEAKSKTFLRNATLRHVERSDGLWFYLDGEDTTGKARHTTGLSVEPGTISADGNTVVVDGPNGERRVWERQPESPMPSAPRAEQVRTGVWKQDLGRSWHECPPARSATEVIRTVTPSSAKVETKYADGTSQSASFELGLGIERTRTGGGGQILSVALDAVAVENRSRNDGVLTSLSHSTVSRDGNTLTFFGWNAQNGRRCSYLTVFDRVK